MDDQAAPLTGAPPLDDRVRTCRPAVVRTRSDTSDGDEPPPEPEANIIRGED